MKKYYLGLIFSLIGLSKGFGQLTYTVSPNLVDLTNYFQGVGLTISNMTVTGAPNSFGLFSGTSNMPFGSGVIMSTGSINNINFPASTLLSSNNSIPGSVLGNVLSGGTTFDECRIEFDCVPSYSNLLFDFAFASEEYNEYVGSSFNDVFGIFVSGPNPAGGNYTNYNCAFIPGTTTPAVSVNSINNGLGSGPCMNCSYYVDNTNGTTVAYDGFTTGLQGLVPVIIGQTYHFTIIIDDVADGIYDSSLMFLANSFKSTTQCAGTFTCNISPSTAASGKIIMYKKSLTGAMMDSVSFINVSSPTFTMAIPDSGRYILKFVPSSLYQISYADTGTSWQNATVFNIPCSGGAYVNFLCSPFASIGSGSGSLSGKVVEGIGFGQKPNGVQAPGNPIGGVVVKGGRNPGGQFFAQTTTDVNGDYSFNNLPDGNYFVLVDIPGLDTTSTHHVDIFGGNTINNLGFVAGSNGVSPSTSINVKEIERVKYSLHIFPNPTKNQFNIEFLVPEKSEISIQIIDVLGKYSKNLFHENNYIGKFSSDFNLNLKPGNYLVKITINTQELISKLIITE